MSLPNPINVTYVSPLISDTFPFIYIVKDTDNIINIDTTHGEVHVILRNIRNSGILQYQPLLSINDGGNNASVNNITIYPSGGDVIQDNTEYVLNNDGANSIIQISNINQWVVSSSQSSGGGGSAFGGTNYIYVYANGTDTENATELQTAYNLAQTMSPSATNRITIVCGNGYYNFGISAFTMSTEYIDLVSLDGNRSIMFNSENSSVGILITANDVFVKGVDVCIGLFGGVTKQFLIGNNLNLLKVENCKGGGGSFGGYSFSSIISSTFINCEGGGVSFGSGANASGTFINCVGGSGSFGGEYSFGNSPIASGIFTNCTAEGGYYGSFGSAPFGGTASGTFTNCIDNSTNGSFGNTLTGKVYFCRTSGTFATVSGGGAVYYSIDGSGNPNNQGFIPQSLL
jgi:hypothetical protein